MINFCNKKYSKSPNLTQNIDSKKEDCAMYAQNISFSYHLQNNIKSKNQTIENISLSIKALDFLGILGPNGCGKSTLMKNLINILSPSAGIITLNNKNIEDFSIKELSKMLGFVPQKSALSMGLLVKDFLLNALYSSLEIPIFGFSKKEYIKVQEIAHKVDIYQFLDSNIFALSGGEFQRVMLARALIKSPKILFLDEPTSALDLNYAIEMLTLCKKIMHENNISVVAILHDLNLASIFCNKIIFLKHGKIMYEGNANDLYTKEILKEIYNLKCEVITFNNQKFVLPSV